MYYVVAMCKTNQVWKSFKVSRRLSEVVIKYVKDLVSCFSNFYYSLCYVTTNDWYAANTQSNMGYNIPVPIYHICNISIMYIVVNRD